MTTFTPELRQAVELAGDQPVEITDPQTNTAYVLLKAGRVQAIARAPGGGRRPWRKKRVVEARSRSAIRVGKRECVLMIRPGAISLANVDAGIRPAVVVSLEELNRGNWVVAVLSTSIAHFVEQFRFLREQFRLGARSIKGDLETPRARYGTGRSK